jgi:[ribosomal protein S5]-alanine N-acetyltransferase
MSSRSGFKAERPTAGNTPSLHDFDAERRSFPIVSKVFQLNLPIHTERLVLRDFSMNDFEDMHDYASDPEVMRYMFHGPRDRAETRYHLKGILNDRRKTPRYLWELAVVDRESGRVAGACDLTLNEDKVADLGYIFSRRFWGRGFATEAAQALVRAGFEELRLERIFSVCDIGHAASGRVLEKAGMRHKGVLERYYEAKGRWWDMHLYEIHRSEWNSTHPIASGSESRQPSGKRP